MGQIKARSTLLPSTLHIFKLSHGDLENWGCQQNSPSNPILPTSANKRAPKQRQQINEWRWINEWGCGTLVGFFWGLWMHQPHMMARDWLSGCACPLDIRDKDCICCVFKLMPSLITCLKHVGAPMMLVHACLQKRRCLHGGHPGVLWLLM